MAIPTSRTKEAGQIFIDRELCTGCGLCVEVCKDFSIKIENHKAVLSDKPAFGCIGCGHCMAICPEGAIKIEGRHTSATHLFELTRPEEVTDYPGLMALLQRRRSIREYKDKNVEREIIDKVLEVAKTAPMGLPPSDVHVMVLDSKEKNHNFAMDFCNYLLGMKWFVSGWFLGMMKPFWGKANAELFRNFVRPLFYIYTDGMKKNENLVTYDAPVAMYFYGSPYSDPADPLIAATYAMLAAESLGLGTCMLGAVHPLIQSGKKAARFRQKHGIKCKSSEGVFVIMGYSKVKYQKGIQRSFASVDFN